MLKKNIISILTKSLIAVMMVTGLCVTAQKPTLQDRTICILIGQKLMWVHPTLDKQTKYSFIFGKHAKQIPDVMECATSKTDGLVFPSWQVQKQLTLQRLLKIQDLVCCQKQGQMLKKCLLIRLYQYPQITRSFLSQYKMGWKDQKQKSLIKYHQESLQGIHLKAQTQKRLKLGKGLTLLLTGKTPGTTPMLSLIHI